MFLTTVLWEMAVKSPGISLKMADRRESERMSEAKINSYLFLTERRNIWH